MCIQNAHGCVFLISITGGKYMLRTQDLNGIQPYGYPYKILIFLSCILLFFIGGLVALLYCLLFIALLYI
jgi:hypothetical protein